MTNRKVSSAWVAIPYGMANCNFEVVKKLKQTLTQKFLPCGCFMALSRDKAVRATYGYFLMASKSLSDHRVFFTSS